MFAKQSGFIPSDSATIREQRYSKFYSGIIHDYFDIDENFIAKVKEILDSRNVESAFELRRESDHNIYQCAYLLQFGVFDTCVAVEKFYESAVKNTNIINILSCKDLINICCIGTKSFFAAVGLCKVIKEFVQQFGFATDKPPQIQVFLISENRTWKRLSQRIVAAANMEYSNLNIKLDFLKADLTKGFSQPVTRRIEKSHIVTVFKYFSTLPSSEINTKITKGILQSMKKKGILYYLDHPSEDQHHITMKELVSKYTPFSEIKSSWIPEKYMLDKGTKLLHTNLYQSISPLNLFWNADILPIIFSTWINYQVEGVEKVMETPQPHPTDDESVDVPEDVVDDVPDDVPESGYRVKPSKNTLRNSTKKFRLVGKFATIDMEKKNKDDSNRHKAKDIAASRYVNFDDSCWYD